MTRLLLTTYTQVLDAAQMVGFQGVLDCSFVWFWFWLGLVGLGSLRSVLLGFAGLLGCLDGWGWWLSLHVGALQQLSTPSQAFCSAGPEDATGDTRVPPEKIDDKPVKIGWFRVFCWRVPPSLGWFSRVSMGGSLLLFGEMCRDSRSGSCFFLRGPFLRVVFKRNLQHKSANRCGCSFVFFRGGGGWSLTKHAHPYAYGSGFLGDAVWTPPPCPSTSAIFWKDTSQRKPFILTPD